MVDAFSEVQIQLYLHFLAKRSSWSKKNLTLLICSVRHSWELRGNNHRIEALRIRLYQTVTGLWPGNMPRFICWAIWLPHQLKLACNIWNMWRITIFLFISIGLLLIFKLIWPACYKLMHYVTVHLQKDNINDQNFRKVLDNTLA